MVNTYVRYMNAPAVKRDKEDTKEKRKFRPKRTKKRGRPEIDPKSRGHEVCTHGDVQYCLRCGRNTKSKTKHKFWVDKPCTPLKRYENWRAMGHEVIHDGKGWVCAQCNKEGTALRGCCGGGRKRARKEPKPEGVAKRNKQSEGSRSRFSRRLEAPD